MLSALAAAPAAALLAGCGSDSTSGGGRTLTYNYWGASDRALLVEKAVRLFEKLHPGTTVKTSFSDFGSYWQKMMTAAAGGNTPDVLEMDYAYIHALGDHGVLADLNPYVGADKQIDLSTLRPQLRASGMVGAKRYAVPVALNSLAVMYDAKLYKEAGAVPPSLSMSYEQCIHETAKISRYTRGKQAGMTDPAVNYQGLEIWLQQHGKALFTASGKLAFEPEDLRTYLTLMQKWRESGGLGPASVINDTLPGTPVGANRAAAVITWDNQLAGFAGQRGSALSLSLPPTDTGVSGVYPKASMLMSISANSPRRALAATFVNFMINDPRVGRILGSNLGMPPTDGQLPYSRTFKGTDAVVRDFEASIASKQVRTPVAPPQAGGEFNTYYGRVYEKLSYRRIGIDEAVKEIFQQAEVILG
ncbi:hypothetical protein BIV57_19275 [Mangrovactinospora gilvigrisea]|uniref:ABC transporter substrate-binding protein n=1 Tax=Mangrovactinospora gilvigrisea TaxID=1428644 RepID=A0A1J7BB62_9ACTN|nr:hypothetical protein BIV57_19275 [Mangrovactinospora gilvigrisea]